jgi:integrase
VPLHRSCGRKRDGATVAGRKSPGRTCALSRARKPGDVRSKAFGHTYCATRLQTTDEGRPVAVYTVSRELGHSSTDMVEGVYSHLGDVRHRADVVEYRVEPFADILGERLRALRVGGKYETVEA